MNLTHAIRWINVKSVVSVTLYILVQLIQPFISVYLWWISGCLYYLVAVQTMHEVSHGVLSNKWWVILSHIGLGGPGWKAKHLLHHRETNKSVDPEVIVTYFLRLHNTQPLRWFHKWQHIYAWVLYCFLHLSIWMDIILGTPNPWRGARYPKINTISHKVSFLGLHIVWPWIVTGCSYAFMYEWIAWLIPSLIITVFFQASHIMEIILTQDCGEWDAVAWCPNEFVTEITGGLNMQPYHHKYPSMPHYVLLKIRDNEKYKAPEVETFLEAVIQHYRALKLLSK